MTIRRNKKNKKRNKKKTLFNAVFSSADQADEDIMKDEVSDDVESEEKTEKEKENQAYETLHDSENDMSGSESVTCGIEDQQTTDVFMDDAEDSGNANEDEAINESEDTHMFSEQSEKEDKEVSDASETENSEAAEEDDLYEIQIGGHESNEVFASDAKAETPELSCATSAGSYDDKGDSESEFEGQKQNADNSGSNDQKECLGETKGITNASAENVKTDAHESKVINENAMTENETASQPEMIESEKSGVKKALTEIRDELLGLSALKNESDKQNESEKSGISQSVELSEGGDSDVPAHADQTNEENQDVKNSPEHDVSGLNSDKEAEVPVISDIEDYSYILEKDSAYACTPSRIEESEDFYKVLDEAALEHSAKMEESAGSSPDETVSAETKDDQYRKLVRFVTEEEPAYYISDISKNGDSVIVKISGVSQSAEDRLVNPKTGKGESLLYVTLEFSKTESTAKKLLVSFSYFYPENRSDYVFDNISEKDSHELINAIYKTFRTDMQKKSEMLLLLQTAMY